MEGNKIILNIAVGGAVQPIEFYPTPENRIWFYAARSSEILVYQSPDPTVSSRAFDKYFQRGDPIRFFRRTDGAITSQGWGQRVTTFE